MSVFKVFNCSNLFLRSFYTFQWPLSSISGLKIFHREFRQFSSLPNACSPLALNNLKSFTPLVIPACGMKTKGHLQLRCKNCYFERKDGEMYVFCTTYGRHKQRLHTKRCKKYHWILSYACTSKVRPY